MAPKTLVLPNQSWKEGKDREEEEHSTDGEEEESESDEERLERSDSEETDGSSGEEEENHHVEPPILSKSGSKNSFKVKLKAKESDSDSEGTPSDFKLHPISKPSSAKRVNQGQIPSRSNKKLKTEDKKASSEEKKSSSAAGFNIPRLWSDEDEIAVLNGMIDFRNANGIDCNSEAFYNFIKGKLQGDFLRDQLRTKISRLKKRFLNALKKGEDGSDPVFTKAHDDRAFELSKKIWGDSVNRPVSVKSEKVKKDIVKVEKVEKTNVKREKGDEKVDFWSKYPFLSLSFSRMRGSYPSMMISESSCDVLKEGFVSIGHAKAKELDQRWRQLLLDETELNDKILTLMTEQIKLGLNHINSS